MQRTIPTLWLSGRFLGLVVLAWTLISCGPTDPSQDLIGSDIDVSNPPQCADPFPVWDDSKETCVQCQDDTQCPIGFCNPDSGDCMACFDDSHCDKGVCVKQKKGGFTCQECTVDKHCIENGTGEYCEPETGSCVGCTSDKQCDDGNPCILNSCTESECVVANADPNTPCDGGECTENGTCFEGSCVADKVTCPCRSSEECVFPKELSKQCAKIGCVAGECVLNFGSGSCEDGNKCTVAEECEQGLCLAKSAEMVDCDDKNDCTLDNCKPAEGCVHEPAKEQLCDDGNPCTEKESCDKGECVPGTKINCDDGNPCTSNSCDPLEGCVEKPVEASCDDGEKCTLEDFCKGGKCMPGKSDECDDKNPCTKDWCSEGKGCAHTNVDGGFCDDGDLCTEKDTCSSGVCQGEVPTCGKLTPVNCVEKCDCAKIKCAGGLEAIDTDNDNCPDTCTTACTSVCECYETKQISLDQDCSELCDTCGDYWSCDDGFCVEQCGSIPDEVLSCQGTLVCSNDGQCGKLSYCQKPDGQCDGSGKCFALVEKCKEDADPVCGCDGKDYLNSCIAAQSGFNVESGGNCDCNSLGCAEGSEPVDTDKDGCADTCLSLSCKSSEQCGSNEYCKSIAGNCDIKGTCTAIEEECKGASSVLVCGCDGKTYDNSCVAAKAGASVLIKGACQSVCTEDTAEIACGKDVFCELPTGLCKEGEGTCAVDVDLCLGGDNPVCGCNNITYKNDCERQSEQIQKLKDGPCKCSDEIKCAAGFLAVDTNKDGCPDSCESQACKGDSQCAAPGLLYCAKQMGQCKSIGKCSFIETEQLCGKEFEPVCGCDGVTYDNQCVAATKGANVAKSGKCDSK